jgi:hypothetical protein
MNSCLLPTRHCSNTPSLQRRSFLFVPFQNDAVHYSTRRGVILNEVKDLTQGDRSR